MVVVEWEGVDVKMGWDMCTNLLCRICVCHHNVEAVRCFALDLVCWMVVVTARDSGSGGMR